MTINTELSKRIYTGNGVKLDYDYDFKIPSAADLKVSLYDLNDVEYVQVLDTDYEITGAGSDIGGQVLFVVPPASGWKVVLLSNAAYIQPTDFKNQGRFFPETHENSYDRGVVLSRQLNERIGRAITLPVQYEGISTDLPAPSPLSIIGWNQFANALENFSPDNFIAAVTAGAKYNFAVTAGQVDMDVSVITSPFAIQAIFYNGIFQDPSAYTLTGNTVQFTESLPVGGTMSVLAIFTSPGQITDPSLLQYQPLGTGALTRPVSARLGDIVSVADYATVQDAVARALAVGASLYWPGGTFPVTGSIPNFHAVRHVGKGIVQRSGVDWKINPIRGQTNTLYVSPSGSDTNDGLTAALPFATIQAAMNVVRDQPDNITGNWVIQLAAGTYPDGGLLSFVRPRHFRLRIIGPAVATNATPTAIIDGTAATTTDGLFFDGCGDVGIENVKIQGFTVDSVAAGVEAANTALLRLVNVHVDNCSVGYYIRSHSMYFVQGGRINACTVGVQELFGVVRNTKTVASLVDGLQITGCTYGIFAKEHCTGHLDWTTIDNCDYGIFFSRSCTANGSDGQITRCDYGVVLRNGSFLVPLRIDYGIGTGNANTVNHLVDHSSGFATNENDVQAQFSAQGERMVAYSAGVAAHTGTTAETRLANFGKLLAGSFDYAGRYARLVIVGAKVGAAGTAALIMDVGGSNGASVSLPAAAGAFRVELWLVSNGQGAQKVFGAADGAGSSNAAARGTRTYAITSNTPIGLDCTLADAADSITIDAAWLYTTGPLLSDGL
jgi:hypothetical protein